MKRKPAITDHAGDMMDAKGKLDETYRKFILAKAGSAEEKKRLTETYRDAVEFFQATFRLLVSRNEQGPALAALPTPRRLYR